MNVLVAVGADADGDRLLALLNKADVNADLVHRTAARPTTTKSRVVSGRHQLLRIDVEEIGECPLEFVQILKNTFEERRFTEPKAIVLSDYAKGVVTYEVAQAAVGMGSRLGIPVLVDPKGPDLAKYRGPRWLRRTGSSWPKQPENQCTISRGFLPPAKSYGKSWDSIFWR